MPPIQMIHFPYCEATKQQEEAIYNLLESVWANNTKPLHQPCFHAISFCAYEQEELIAYASVLQWQQPIEEQLFRVGGLSCVCTQEWARHQGIGQ